MDFIASDSGFFSRTFSLLIHSVRERAPTRTSMATPVTSTRNVRSTSVHSRVSMEEDIVNSTGRDGPHADLKAHRTW